MQADVIGFSAIEVKSLNCFLNVGTQFVPSISLSEDAPGEALSAKAAVGLLGYIEDDLVYWRSPGSDSPNNSDIGIENPGRNGSSICWLPFNSRTESAVWTITER